jgi:hypothetical protein
MGPGEWLGSDQVQRLTLSDAARAARRFPLVARARRVLTPWCPSVGATQFVVLLALHFWDSLGARWMEFSYGLLSPGGSVAK